jgi:hypothetical protein
MRPNKSAQWESPLLPLLSPRTLGQGHAAGSIIRARTRHGRHTKKDQAYVMVVLSNGRARVPATGYS